MTPTVTGWYWMNLKHRSLVTGELSKGHAEVVMVSMTYTHRGKVVPHVIGQHWHAPLAVVRPDEAEWSGPLVCPFKQET